MDPSFRTVNFAVEPHVAIVSIRLRYAWHMLPSEDTTPHSVELFIKGQHERNKSDSERVPQDPDLESLHTPWRDSIYHMWNHVFYDVMKFLTQSKCTVGDFHPPSHEGFALKYQKPQDGTLDVVCKSWDTNVLLIPAYQASKVTIRVTGEQSIDERTSEMELGTFSDSNLSETWWVKKGVKVNFYVEGEWETDCQGLAAVMVCGILCTEYHETEDDETENDGAEYDGTESDETENDETKNQDTETRETGNHETENYEPEQQKDKTEPPSQD